MHNSLRFAFYALKDLWLFRKVFATAVIAAGRLEEGAEGGRLAHRYIAIFLCIWDDQHRNTNMNDKDHLVGQLTSGR